MDPLQDIAEPGEQRAQPKTAAPPATSTDPLSDLVPTGAGTAPPAATPQEQEQVKSWAEVPGAAARHLVPSAMATGEAMAQPFIHPIQTYENLRDIGHGILQKAGVMSGQEDTPKVDAVMDYFKNRYGGVEQLRNTLANDPVGFATDAATILTGGEAALGRVAGTAAKAAGTVGRTIEPMAIPRAMGRGLVPGTEDATTLAKAGVTMTPGQMMGGFGKTAEDMLTSVPWLGHWIQKGRLNSIESFNKGIANEVLKPIGESVDRGVGSGHDLITHVNEKLSDAYGKITPNLKWTPDKQYWGDIASIYQNDYPLLPEAQQKQFDSILGKKIPPDGAPFKEAESTISSFANKYMHSSLASERDLGQLVNKVLVSMRENLARTNPAEAAELAKVNGAYAMFTRMRNAAAMGQEGVFSPAQLLRAVKSGDKSIGKGSFAKGDALLQPIAELGQRVLPSKVPTSGTTERAALMGALFGEGYLYSPQIAMGVGAGMLPYTKPGMAATNLLFRGAGKAGAPISYLPRGTTYQLGKMDESQQEAYDRARRFFPP